MKKILTVFVFVTILLSLSAEDFSVKTLNKLDKLLEKETKSLNHGGISFTLANDEDILHSKGFGWADEEAQWLMSGDTPLNIASVTKLFTATAVTQLVMEGKLDLDVPVKTYIPEFSLLDMEDEEVTLRLILAHYSALPSDFLKGYINEWDGEGDVHEYFPQFISDLKEEHAPTPAGKIYRYSNTGYEIAAYIVAKVSGKSFADYVKEEILVPLNMSSSGLPDRGELEARMSKGYSPVEEVNITHLRGTGEGDMISTTDDLSRFGMAFLMQNSTILSTQGLRMMLSKQNHGALMDFDLYRGLGWYREEIPGFPGKYYYYHEGGTYPYSSMLIIVPEARLTFALLSNEDEHSFDMISVKILQTLMEVKTGEKPENIYSGKEKTVELDPSYMGVYATEMGMMTISDSWSGPILNMFGMKLNIVREKDGFYGLQYRILGLIPLPISDLKGIKFKFQDNDVKSLGFFTWGKYRGLGTLITENPIHEKWENRLGEYKIINPDEENFLTSFAIEMDDETGLPIVRLQVALINNDLIFPLNLSNPDFAVFSGYGRHMGDWLRVTSKDGNETLLYSGYYLRRQ